MKIQEGLVFTYFKSYNKQTKYKPDKPNFSPAMTHALFVYRSKVIYFTQPAALDLTTAL